ncbi:MAG: tetratricopeptide repeat protein, partial [Erythrobacter sp.]|nr:tetratricopeptide repeat protein [Erythrobacter sp.]
AGQFGRALTLLIDQAEQLTDPDLARRALRLAEFLRDDAQSLRAAARLAVLDSSDGQAAATTMALLCQAGQTASALPFANLAKQRSARINAPLLVANFTSLAATDRATVAEGIIALASQWPEDNDIAIAEALLYREQADLTRAKESLDALLARAPDEERALVLWTQIALDADDEAPFARIAEAVAADPEWERLRLHYARLLAANQFYDEARAEFAILIGRSPEEDEYLMASALIDLELDRYDDAILSLQSLVDTAQRLDEAYYYLGRTYQERADIEAGDVNKAIEAYGQVGSLREFADAKRRAGVLLLSQGAAVAALSDFYRAQRDRFSDQQERLYMIEAELLRDLDETQALEVYTTALGAFPESMALRYGRAMLLESGGDIAAMEADLRRILSDDPDNATTLNALGYTLTNHTERYEEAASLIERALEISPGEPAMLDSLGWVYFKMGRLVEAESILKEAYTRLPDPEVAAHLGETLWAQGKQLEARDVWRSGLEVDANSGVILTTIERLGVALD